MSTPFATGPLSLRRSRTVRLPSTRRRRRDSAARSGNLNLVSAGTSIPIKLVEQSPSLVLLAVEDLCWQLAVADHAGRRPAIWQRAARAAWNAERSRWDGKRERLAALAGEAIAEL